MSNLIVYSLVHIERRTVKKGQEPCYPIHKGFKLLSYDGRACVVKPCGKGNHFPIEVSAELVAVQPACNELIPLSSATASDLIYAVTKTRFSIRRC